MAEILIVHDQPCVRELISEALTLEGYHVHGVGDAESVREHLQSSQPDMVLLDSCLEGLEGFELLEEVKRLYPCVPVIIANGLQLYR